MKTLSFYTKIYFMIVSQFIKARMQFRADFIISSIGVIFENITGIFTLWILFKTIPLLEGWNYYELIFIYGYSQLAYIIGHLFFIHIWNLGFHLREGNFIKYYFKPLNSMFYYMADEFDIKGLSQLIMGIVILAYSSAHLGLNWTVLKILLLILTLLGASLIMVSILVIAGSTAFWATDASGLLGFTLRLHSFAKYPVSIFNKFFKFMFTFIIPIGFIAYYPSQIFLRPLEHNSLIFISPFIGIILFIIAYMVWNKGINRYSGTGS
ncbi:ABC transporter permease [Acetivibrio cellulolyticus]|uniref:ABC transporter permease n=1 Tax=Acetivibrio cellulolyticus TaxID=35830 RepID=UPI0001E2D093|nr:ABC-2 family transporter protein [Acetivibrio cellulolyticus]